MKERTFLNTFVEEMGWLTNPRTTGEKMFVGGIMIDIGVVIIHTTISHLQSNEVINLTIQQEKAIHNLLIWGAHILVSDAIFKFGGVMRMCFFEKTSETKN